MADTFEYRYEPTPDQHLSYAAKRKLQAALKHEREMQRITESFIELLRKEHGDYIADTYRKQYELNGFTCVAWDDKTLTHWVAKERVMSKGK